VSTADDASVVGGADGDRSRFLAELGTRVRRARERGPRARQTGALSQRSAGELIGRSRRWWQELEAGRVDPQLSDLERVASLLGVSVGQLLRLEAGSIAVEDATEDGDSRARLTLPIDPDDVPPVEDVEEAVQRLRRSYSTTPPLELEQRVGIRLQQVRWLLAGQAGGSARRGLTEAAAWLVLLRGTVQFDSRQHEAAWTSVRAAQHLARDIGHGELQAWTFETMAWMAATDNRQHDARELATAGISVAPAGGYGLVAATLQRARINGAIGDRPSTMHDLRAGERALAAAGEPTFPDDHYAVDPAKARFFASGAWAQLRRPAETIENAAEVVRASEDPRTRNFWPMRVANARVEWAMALTELGREDEAAALARLALDPLWLRPDTERRLRALLARMRDSRLRRHLADELHESQVTAALLAE
jgi:transcriptional regulator with XRE-family HTH domain